MATFDLGTLRTITILYVEDEAIIREQSLKAYNKLFKTVYSAVNGEEALKIFLKKKDDIDVIITDINMPKLSGLELAKKALEVSDIPVIVTTAHTDTNYLLDAIDIGIKKYEIKPITLNGIVQDIERVVTQYRKDTHIKDIAKTLLLKSKNTADTLNKFIEENRALEKSNQFYKNLVDNYVPMVKTDKNGIILEISKQLSKMLSDSQEELIGENISHLKDSSCKNISFQKQMLKAIHKKVQIKSTHTLKNKNNKSFIYDVNMIVFYGEDSLVSGYTLYFNLISSQNCTQ